MPGSVITFDPDRLERRLGELETDDERARLLGRPGAGAEDLDRAFARRSPARACTSGSGRTTRTRPTCSSSTPRWPREIEASIVPLRRELEPAAGGGALRRRLRPGRRGRHAPVGDRRHRRAGLDGDDAADVRALGRRPRLQDLELLEASPGEEAGLKSATFTVGGENAYGILKAERGKHRLVRQSPFDQAHRRHTAFATVIVAPLLPRRRRRRDRRGRPEDRHVSRAGRRRPAREQDRQRRPDHAPPDRDRRPVPERAFAVGEQADRDARPEGAARRARRGGA